MNVKLIKTIVVLIALTFCLGLNASENHDNETFIDKSDKRIAGELTVMNLNLNEESAVTIAEIVLVHIYGEKVLKQKPWIVKENKNEFKIEGRLPPQYNAGGVATIVIQKSDARVLYYSHDR